MRTGRKTILSLGLLACMVTSALAAEVFNPWRVKISFSGYDKDETLVNVPVLVQLSTNVTGFSYDLLGSPADGADLRFKVVSDGDELNYAISSWNTSGVSHVWVQVPELASTNDYIYAFFGDESATAPAYTTNGATWSAGFQGVWHMQNATNVLDSSGNANHGTGSTGIGSTNAGIAGNALSLNGTSHHVDCGSVLNMRLNDVTLSIWFKTSSATFDGGLLGKTVYGSVVGRYGLYRSGANLSGMAQFSGGVVTGSHAWDYSDGAWHQATVTFNRTGNMTVYVDGIQKTATSISAHSANDMNPANIRFWIGTYGNASGTGPQTSFYFPGQLDEARMLNVAVSSNWVWTAWANQKPGSTFLAYGSVETNAPVINTTPPTDIGLTTATIHGRLIGLWEEPNPALYLCWGAEDGDTEATNAWDQVVLMGDTWGAGQSFSYAASGFTPGSTNVYRVFATNDAHSAWSGIRSFTNYNTITVATLPLDAGEINVASATLRGEVTDTGGMVPYAGFEWWPTGGSVTSSVSLGLQSGAFDELVFGLARDTEYTFRVWASNAVAGRVVSAPAVFTTLDADFRTLTWNGSASSDWFDPANWDDAAGVAPTTDDIIVINSGSVLLTNETAILKSLTLGNATLTFSNWTTRLTAETVEIGSGGNMTTAGAFGYPSAMSNRVHIVADSLFVKTGGQINVDSKGYRVANGPAKGYQSGSNFNAGGGHGGRGGDEQGGPGGPEWGVPETPVWPGSGGGQYLSDAGGNGGGVVRIEGGTVTINGTISANGQNGSTYNGGGAGGAIWITCHTFVGTNGIIRANGGNGGSAYGGGGAGGGRIAVDYQNITGECSVLFSTKAGLLFSTIPAGVGTLWLPDTTLIDDGLDTRFDHVRLIVPGWTSFSVGDLDLNGLTVAFGEEGFHLTVTNNLSVRNNGSLVVGGKAIVTRSLMPDSVIPASTNVTVNVGGNVWIEGGSLIVGGQWQSGFSYLNVAGDLTLTNAAANAGRLLVGAGITNTTDLVGGSVNITGAFTITSNAWYHPYSHPTNGGSVRLQSASLTVAAGGGVDVNIAGFQSYANIAYGPGFGKSSGSRGGGGGYGGAGGRGADGNSHGGGVYGETNRPLHAGSAGGFGHSPQPGYGHGGGYVRIETGPLVLNGTMTANGRNAISTYGGGGSGGGVFILCDSFEGSASGLVSARGGNGGGVSGGGGGGRVAMAIGMSPADRTKLIDGDEVDGLFVYSTHGPFLGTVSVTNGTTPAGYTPLPEPGTAVFMTVAAGTFSLVVEGNPGAYGTPQPMNYGTTIGITADSILTNSVVTPANEANGLRRACIGWDLADESENPVDSDVTAQAVFTLSANRILTWNWTNEYELVVEAGPNGSVNNGTVDGWYTNQVEVASITATADGGFRFIGWIGDVPVADLTNNPLTLVMDQPRTIQAEFGSISGQFKTWTGNGTWSDFGNWDPPGAPGPNDTITIASGNLLLPAARTVKSAMVNSGATVVFTNWSTALTAGQDVTIAGTVTLPPPFRYDTEMSNRVWIICRDFTLAEGGLINVDAKGYFTHTGPGSTTGGHSNRGSGAGHGGKGGDSPTIVGGVIYGITNAPVMPGSGGGGSYDNAAGHGGGTVWIDATRNVVVDGTISANGGGGGTYNGGGSGGSIFIVAGNSFAGAATGIIRANGGNRGSGYSALGGGGGGRVAVWHQPVDPADRVILMEGGEVKRMEIHGTLPTYLGMATANAATLSNDPPGDGTVIFLRVAPPAGTVFLIR